MENRITSREILQQVVQAITFGPSGVMLDKMDIQWEITDVAGGQMSNEHGWHVRFTFARPDTVTGEMGRGAGRWEFVPFGAWESSVVKTCWLLLELLVRHELMESFQYRGVKLFDPHKTVEALALPWLLQ